MNKKSLFDVIKPGIMLGVIALCVTLLLAVAHEMTKEPINQTRMDRINSSLSLLFPEADNFEQLSDESDDSDLYTASRSGQPAGLCILIQTTGYSDEIYMMVGFDNDGNILGTTITEMSETPGLGTLAREDKFLNQYIGKTPPLALTKNGGQIVAVSGATVTSAAVTQGINDASAIVQAYLKGGKPD